MANLLSHTATNVYGETTAIAAMAKMQQLYAIPALINEFVPMFTGLANGFGSNSENMKEITVQSVSLEPQQYFYCPTSTLNEYIQSVSTAATACSNIANLLAQLSASINGLLKTVKVSHKKKRLFLSVPTAFALEANVTAIIGSNQQFQQALDTILVNGLKIRKYQTNVCAQNFLGSKFTFLTQVNATFAQLNPMLNSFAAAFVTDGKLTRKHRIGVKISKINYQIRATANASAHYIRVLGDYFEMFNQSLEYIQKSPNC